jgi:C-terminal processing protease CtpA/Prc
VGFVLSNGKKVEGEGVIPDVAVPPTLADLRLGRDRALEEAQALLSKESAAAGGSLAPRPDAGGVSSQRALH